MGNVRPLISENAARLRGLHDAIHRTFREQPHGPEHHAACAAFHAGYDGLAFPGGLRDGLARLKRLDTQAVDVAIQFLEEDPWFHRSGYVKEEIVRRLKHAAFSNGQRARLQAIVLRSVSEGTRRISSHLARLAPLIRLQAFQSSLDELSRSSDREARLRAQHVVRVMKSAGRK